MTSVGILAVGTELTTGQTINTNAAWLSQRLGEVGLSDVVHTTVADDKARILSALNTLAQTCDLLIVSGGLGPTSDDFTREVIAEFLQEPLVFYEPSYQKIEARLNAIGYPMNPSQRQQCYYPESATIIENTRGTADAFCIHREHQSFVVLPGPPSEIAHLWDAHLKALVLEWYPQQNPLPLYTWQCLGASESILGERLEALLQGRDALTGYRAHFPYVELKVWTQDTTLPALIEKHFQDEIVLFPGEDAAVLCVQGILNSSKALLVVDNATQGLLGERLLPELRKTQLSWRYVVGQEEVVDSEQVTLILDLKQGTAEARLYHPLRESQARFVAHYPLKDKGFKQERYWVEQALIFWARALS